jgi:hypothetical protein
MISKSMKASKTLRTQEFLRTHEHIRAQYNFHKSLGAEGLEHLVVSIKELVKLLLWRSEGRILVELQDLFERLSS